MEVERGRIELRQDVDTAKPGVDAVGQRNVYQTELGAKGHRGLGAILGQRKQSRTFPTTHDNREHFRHASILEPAVKTVKKRSVIPLTKIVSHAKLYP